jgi:SAM-dependent methyltransferase
MRPVPGPVVAAAVNPKLKSSRRTRWLDGAVLLLTVTGAVAAHVSAAEFQPVPGMPGKDVVWIPSPEQSVNAMLDLARITPRDYVIDLGSGDGRNVIGAAKRGARALGVEYNPDLVELSRRAAAEAGVAERAAFVQGDMFEADISQASVLLLFILPAHLTRLAPKFLGLRPGTRIVTNTYEIGGGWEPDDSARAEPCLSWCILSLYVVPAQVAGVWRMPTGATLFLEQNYQKLRGQLELDGLSVPIEDGRLRGNDIRFRVNSTEYTGRINGDTMEGVAKGRVTQPWSATLLR